MSRVWICSRSYGVPVGMELYSRSGRGTMLPKQTKPRRAGLRLVSQGPARVATLPLSDYPFSAIRMHGFRALAAAHLLERTR